MSNTGFFDVRYTTPKGNEERALLEYDLDEIRSAYGKRYDEITKFVRIETNKDKKFFETIFPEILKSEYGEVSNIRVELVPPQKIDSRREHIEYLNTHRRKPTAWDRLRDVFDIDWRDTLGAAKVLLVIAFIVLLGLFLIASWLGLVPSKEQDLSSDFQEQMRLCAEGNSRACERADDLMKRIDEARGN